MRREPLRWRLGTAPYSKPTPIGGIFVTSNILVSKQRAMPRLQLDHVLCKGLYDGLAFPGEMHARLEVRHSRYQAAQDVPQSQSRRRPVSIGSRPFHDLLMELGEQDVDEEGMEIAIQIADLAGPREVVLPFCCLIG